MEITVQDIDRARALFFQALSNINRIKILAELIEKPLSVGEISKKLKLEQSHVSHSLNCLEFCGFVNCKREGKRIIYKANVISKELIKIADEHISKYAQHLYTCKVLRR